MEEGSALADLIAHCQACGVRRFGLVTAYGERGLPVLAAAAQAGLQCQHLIARPAAVRGELENVVERAGFTAIARLLAGRARLPELLYFDDDYLARGGLAALLAAGLRIPDEVQVASHVNVGHAPVMPWPLTRIEHDPRGDAVALADLVRRVLQQPSSPPLCVTVQPRFVAGQSTRPAAVRRPPL
jgi:DNA-binding LacI/PurR family transcriptional regulator